MNGDPESASENSSAGAACVDTDFVTDHIQSILNDMDDFLLGWFDRLQRDIDASDNHKAAESGLNQRLEGFSQRMQVWQAKKEAEERRLTEQSEQLTEAWLRLESEQRMLLQMKEQPGPAAPERSLQRDGGVTSQCSEVGQPQFASGTTSTAPSGSCQSSPLASQKVSDRPRSDAAVDQFQRLKKEVDRGRSESATA